MQPTVREATPDDADAVRDVHLASIRGLGGEAYDDEVVAAWAHPRDPGDYPVEDDDTHFLAAEAEGRVVGFGWLTVPADDYFRDPVDAEVTAVYVHPEFADVGVGAAVHADLEAHARARGAGSLGCWASLNAVPFYEVQGYVRVTAHDHEFADGVTGTVVEMRKSLNDRSE